MFYIGKYIWRLTEYITKATAINPCELPFHICMGEGYLTSPREVWIHSLDFSPVHTSTLSSTSFLLLCTAIKFPLVTVNDVFRFMHKLAWPVFEQDYSLSRKTRNCMAEQEQMLLEVAECNTLTHYMRMHVTTVKNATKKIQRFPKNGTNKQ